MAADGRLHTRGALLIAKDARPASDCTTSTQCGCTTTYTFNISATASGWSLCSSGCRGGSCLCTGGSLNGTWDDNFTSAGTGGTCTATYVSSQKVLITQSEYQFQNNCAGPFTTNNAANVVLGAATVTIGPPSGGNFRISVSAVASVGVSRSSNGVSSAVGFTTSVPCGTSVAGFFPMTGTVSGTGGTCDTNVCAGSHFGGTISLTVSLL